MLLSKSYSVQKPSSVKEAKILKELQHKNIVSLKAVWEEPMTMMSDSPF